MLNFNNLVNCIVVTKFMSVTSLNITNIVSSNAIVFWELYSFSEIISFCNYHSFLYPVSRYHCNNTLPPLSTSVKPPYCPKYSICSFECNLTRSNQRDQINKVSFWSSNEKESILVSQHAQCNNQSHQLDSECAKMLSLQVLTLA